MRTALCLFVAVLAMVSAAPSLAELSGTPTGIDGDTIEIAGRRIHLYGIDAPELAATLGGRAEIFGKERIRSRR